MLLNLQLVRGLAALGVVYYHTHFVSMGSLSTEFHGVAIFFVLSGFIITLVTQQSATHYALKRLIRVVPMYWLATLAFALCGAFGLFNPLYVVPTWFTLFQQGHLSGWFSNQASSALTLDLWQYAAESMSFLPMDRPPLLGVGWTLIHEMYFYAIFGVSLFVSKNWAPLIASAFIVITICLGDAFEGQCGTVCSFYASEKNALFVLGILLYYAWRLTEGIEMPYGILAFVASLIVAAIVIGCLGFLFYIPPLIAAPAVIAAALLFERAGLRCRNHILLLLGDASYSIYLTHLFLIEPFRAIGEQVPWFNQATSFPVMALALFGSALLGIAVHLGIEKPILRLLHRRFIGERPPVSARSAEV